MARLKTACWSFWHIIRGGSVIVNSTVYGRVEVAEPALVVNNMLIGPASPRYKADGAAITIHS